MDDRESIQLTQVDRDNGFETTQRHNTALDHLELPPSDPSYFQNRGSSSSLAERRGQKTSPVSVPGQEPESPLLHVPPSPSTTATDPSTTPLLNPSPSPSPRADTNNVFDYTRPPRGQPPMASFFWDSIGRGSVELTPHLTAEHLPPPYDDLIPPGGMTFVDFTPKCLCEGGIIRTPTFERFDVLVARANAWLRKHQPLRAQWLETVDYKAAMHQLHRGATVDAKRATRTEAMASGSLTIKILRMWVTRRDQSWEGNEVQQIGYLNVVPACQHPGGFLDKPVFDTLTVTMNKLNEMLQHRPLPGRVLSMETFPMRFRQYGKWIDPNRCHWRDHSDISVSNLTVIRVYYTAGAPKNEKLGFKDIVPGTYQALFGDVYQLQFENFAGLPSKINNWLRDNSKETVSLVNVQTLNHKIRDLTSGQVLDTEKTLTTSFRTPNLLQVVRVWYVVLNTDEQERGSSPPSPHTPRPSPIMVRRGLLPGGPRGSPRPRSRTASMISQMSDDINFNIGCRHITSKLSCRTFVPRTVPPDHEYGHTGYEPLSKTRKRVEAWLNFNKDLKVISAETSSVLLDMTLDAFDQNLPLYYPNRGMDDDFLWLQVLRVYYEGVPVEPPDDNRDQEEYSQSESPQTNRPSRCTVM